MASSESALILKNRKYLKCRPDLILKGKTSEYKIHRIVVLCLSPYFQTLFHYSLSTRNGYYILDMKDTKNYILTSIINYAYNGMIDINRDNVEDLLITSDKYNIISITRLCEQFLWTQVNDENRIDVYLLSHFYNCHQLKGKIEKSIESKGNEELTEFVSQFNDLVLKQ